MNPKIKKIIVREGLFSLLLFIGIISLILEQNYILAGVAEVFVRAGLRDTPETIHARHQRRMLETASHRIGIGLIAAYCCYLVIRLIIWEIRTLKKNRIVQK
jgi:hypothetical protein